MNLLLNRLKIVTALVLCSGSLACSFPADVDSGESRVWACVLDSEQAVSYSDTIGCDEDFALLSAAPLDASIPGARSVKTVIDRIDGDSLYFQNTNVYPLHWDFASTNLSGQGLPIVPDMSGFNSTEYYSPDRRFLLGAVTYYEGPNVWAFEIAPYDSASPEMVEIAFDKVRNNVYFSSELAFHPTSESVLDVAKDLPADIPIVTTEEIFAGVDYQPLNLATSVGRLTFHSAQQLAQTEVDFRETVVLESVPNDISVVAGIITDKFQTPLAHINVLSQNRGTPNMGLRGAFHDETLRGLEGKWVELSVGAFDYHIREVSQVEADAWWEQNKPEPLSPQPMDPSLDQVIDAEQLFDDEAFDLAERLGEAIPKVGGKAAHFAALTLQNNFEIPRALIVPVYFYDQHMTTNGLWDRVEHMLADPTFKTNADVRSEELRSLRDAIREAPINSDLVELIEHQIISGYEQFKYPMTRFRFRSSTTAEDIEGFNGAGLYTSVTADPAESDHAVAEALKAVWASAWNDRAFSEREYYSIDHREVGMAILSHRSFPDEDANGVAITANVFDTYGGEPGFYVNVQRGDNSVVEPALGITSDQYLHYFEQPGQPVVYLARSNLVDAGDSVLTNQQINELGEALAAIQQQFAPVYMRPNTFYGMDVEFKFDSFEYGKPVLYVKQARPYPGWNSDD